VIIGHDLLMTNTIMVEISADEFARTHKGLIRLLQAIDKSGSEGISTRELCYKVFASRDTFCVKQLEYAEKQGYISRKTVPLGGRGHPYTVNRITAKGKNLLKELANV
jgi:hypothetical protein